MGYTHYWTQRRDIGRAAWEEIKADLQAITTHCEHAQDVALRGPDGETPSRPEFTAEHVAFNGAGEDSHESFCVYRIRPPLESWQTPDRRGWDFCKTARKPYDVAVTASLCYLATIAETHTASSDGNGRDWLAGLEVARQALPRYANRLDIPRGILEADRWCSPYPSLYCKGYEFNFCVDGRAYIMGPGGKSYRFRSHYEAAQWAATWTEKPTRVTDWHGRTCYEGDGPLFSPSGFFDVKRQSALARQQTAALRQMLERATGDRAAPPPAMVRPGDLVPLAEPLAYSLTQLLEMPHAA